MEMVTRRGKAVRPFVGGLDCGRSPRGAHHTLLEWKSRMNFLRRFWLEGYALPRARAGGAIIPSVLHNNPLKGVKYIFQRFFPGANDESCSDCAYRN